MVSLSQRFVIKVVFDFKCTCYVYCLLGFTNFDWKFLLFYNIVYKNIEAEIEQVLKNM